MNRAYFDLRAEGDFSFAAYLAARGFIVVTLDHLGVGDSSRPADGFALTPDVLVEANAIAMGSISRDLEHGRLTGRAVRSAALGRGRALDGGHADGHAAGPLRPATPPWCCLDSARADFPRHSRPKS